MMGLLSFERRLLDLRNVSRDLCISSVIHGLPVPVIDHLSLAFDSAAIRAAATSFQSNDTSLGMYAVLSPEYPNLASHMGDDTSIYIDCDDLVGIILGTIEQRASETIPSDILHSPSTTHALRSLLLKSLTHLPECTRNGWLSTHPRTLAAALNECRSDRAGEHFFRVLSSLSDGSGVDVSVKLRCCEAWLTHVGMRSTWVTQLIPIALQTMLPLQSEGKFGDLWMECM